MYVAFRTLMDVQVFFGGHPAKYWALTLLAFLGTMARRDVCLLDVQALESIGVFAFASYPRRLTGTIAKSGNTLKYVDSWYISGRLVAIRVASSRVSTKGAVLAALFTIGVEPSQSIDKEEPQNSHSQNLHNSSRSKQTADQIDRKDPSEQAIGTIDNDGMQGSLRCWRW